MPIHLAMPWCLAGLLAVAAPVAAHLLAARVRRRVPFGAMRFLLAAAHTPARHHRVRRLAVLAARCLLIAALVLTLAGPYLGDPPRTEPPAVPGSSTVSADHRPDAVVFVLDNSASSNRPRGGATVFTHMLTETRRRLDDLDPRRTAAAVVLAAPRPTPILPLLTPRLGGLRQQLDTAQAAAARGDLPAALRLACRLLDGPPHVTRRIVLLSDMQSSTLDDQARAAVASIPRDIELEIVPLVGDAPPPTLAGPAAPARAGLFTPTPLSVAATNHGRADISAEVSLVIDHVATQSRRVSLPANSTTPLTFEHAFQTPGEHAVAVTLTPRGGPTARACWVTTAADRARVVVLAPPEALRGPTGWAFLLAAAWSPDERSPLSVSLVPDTRATPEDLARADLLVFTDPSRLHKVVVEALAASARAGGATLLVLDPQTPAGAFDSLPPDFARSLPITPRQARSAERTAPGQLSLHTPNPAHPFLAPLGLPVVHMIESTPIHAAPAAAVATAVPVLAYSDGTPALALQSRVACLNLIPDFDTSDLPRRPAFVALAQHLADQLLTSAPQISPLHTGDALPAAPHDFSASPQAPRFADEPGVYPLESRGHPPRLIAANLDPREADPDVTTTRSLLAARETHATPRTEITSTQAASTTNTTVEAPHHEDGLSLRTHCLAIAALLLALESLLVGPTRRSPTLTTPPVMGTAMS